MEARMNRAADFYSRIATAYDLLARHGPGVSGLRREFVAALAPSPGDTVVEFGCGTGANTPFIRNKVDPDGRVVGVDFAPGALRRAMTREDSERTEFVRADACTPPIVPAAPNAVCASFLMGMLAAPERAVRDWASLLGDGGRLALLDLARSTGNGRMLNPAFRLFVRMSAPPTTAVRPDRDLAAELDRRVVRAHRTLREVCDEHTYETRWLGFARLSAGRVSGK